MREQAARLRQQHADLGADVARVHAIRGRLPEVQQQCDRFFQDEFLEAKQGYSTVVGDLTHIAEKSGLHATSVNFKQRELEKRGVSEVGITALVEGDYASLVRFINGIERSENFYLVDSLSMASGASGGVKLNLQLRTYFRN
jgi:Tfp pilus assembly protein PilO